MSQSIMRHHDESGVGNADHRVALAVEDDGDVRAVAAAMLSALGFRVVEAETADQALKALGEDSEIELLLTDVVMPGTMSGIELAAECLRRYPDIKVVVMTGYSDEVLWGVGGLGENTVILHKPFSSKDLAAAVRTIIGEV